MAGSDPTFPCPSCTSIGDEYQCITQQYKLEDSSFNWIDATQPEYYLSDNEVFLEDASGPRKVMKMLLTWAGVLGFVGVLHWLFVNYRVHSD